MASQTEVLKALHEKEGPIKSPDLARGLKTSDDTIRALISKLKKKTLVDGDAKEGWYITDAGIKILEAGESIPTTITDVGEDELSKFKYYGQLAGAKPDDIAAASELFQNSDMRIMAEVERVLAETNVPITSRTRWINLYRGYLRNTTPPEIRDELYPLPPTPEARRVPAGEGATGIEEVTRGERLDYIVEGNEIHRVGDSLGEFNFKQALQVVAAKRGATPKAEADGSLTGALNAFAEALKSTSPSQPLTVQDVLNIINTMKENSGEASAPGYVDEDGDWHELKPGQPVILKRSAQSPSTGKTLVIKQTPEGIVAEEHQAGSPIIINANPPPANTAMPATAMPPMMPFPVIGSDGTPVVDRDGHPVYANIEPMLKWLGFQSEQRRADERHTALMGLAQTVRENVGDGIQALKAAAAEAKKGSEATAAKPESAPSQGYECGQCKTRFTIPTTEGWETLKCPNPNCGKTWTREEVLGK
jgi:hypothetical protein